jgi:hypothetical protein
LEGVWGRKREINGENKKWKNDKVNRFFLEAREDEEERERVGGRGEKWPKQCMHMWINK